MSKSEFPVEHVTPMVLHPQDSRWAAGQLGNVRGFYQVDDDQFNHWDFLWSVNVNAVLYDHLIPLFR